MALHSLLDFISIEMSLLHFTKVPGDNELSGGSNDRILLLAFSLIKPKIANNNKFNKRQHPYIRLPYRAGVKDTSCFI